MNVLWVNLFKGENLTATILFYFSVMLIWGHSAFEKVPLQFIFMLKIISHTWDNSAGTKCYITLLDKKSQNALKNK